MSGYEPIAISTQVANKSYRCIWCGEPIKKGDTYTRDKCVFDGEFQANRYHPECFAYMQKYAKEEGVDHFTPFSAPRPEPQPPTAEESSVDRKKP
jgi:hypothetical protein